LDRETDSNTPIDLRGLGLEKQVMTELNVCFDTVECLEGGRQPA